MAGGQCARPQWTFRNRSRAVRSGDSRRLPLFLEMGPLSNVNKMYLHGRVPEWNNYMEHPDYDEFWRKQNPLPHLKNITHPVLNVAGWFDAEDFYGPMTIYQQIEKSTPDNRSTL